MRIAKGLLSGSAAVASAGYRRTQGFEPSGKALMRQVIAPLRGVARGAVERG